MTDLSARYTSYSKETATRLLKELQDNPRIELRSASEIHPPCRGNTFDIAKDSMGVVLPEEMRSFYAQTDGLKIVWEHDGVVGGEANIVPIMDSLLEAHDEEWKEEVGDSESQDNPTFQALVKNLYSLDIYDEAVQGTLRVVMEIDKTSASPRPRLWLWHLAGEKFPLSLTFQEYIDKLLKTRGFYGWQYFFIDLDACDFDDPYFSEFFAESCFDALSKMEEFMNTMPTLFPEDDFSEFKKLQEKLIENYNAG